MHPTRRRRRGLYPAAAQALLQATAGRRQRSHASFVQRLRRYRRFLIIGVFKRPAKVHSSCTGTFSRLMLLACFAFSARGAFSKASRLPKLTADMALLICRVADVRRQPRRPSVALLYAALVARCQAPGQHLDVARNPRRAAHPGSLVQVLSTLRVALEHVVAAIHDFVFVATSSTICCRSCERRWCFRDRIRRKFCNILNAALALAVTRLLSVMIGACSPPPTSRPFSKWLRLCSRRFPPTGSTPVNVSRRYVLSFSSYWRYFRGAFCHLRSRSSPAFAASGAILHDDAAV